MFLYNLHINETKIEQIHISHGFQTSNYEKEKKNKVLCTYQQVCETDISNIYTYIRTHKCV